MKKCLSSNLHRLNPVRKVFDNVTHDVQEGEVVSAPSEMKSEVSKRDSCWRGSQTASEQAPAPLDEPSENFEKIQHALTESGISMQTIRSYVIGCLIFIVVVLC